MNEKQYRGSYVKHNDKGYYCPGCFNYTKKKYYLKKLQDSTGTAWRCPYCGHMWMDWAFEREWKLHLEELNKIKVK